MDTTPAAPPGQALPNLERALRIARRFPVFPCRLNPEIINGIEYGPKSPHCAGGFHAATQDQQQIRAWWKQWPDALVGVPTGHITGLLVVDVDPAGAEWYSEHAAELGCGCVNKTPRGHHLLYGMPAEDLRCSAGRIAAGIDVRANLGYAIWWVCHGYKRTGSLEDITLPPAWLTAAILKAQSSARASAGGNGTRNDYLTSHAGVLRRQGATEEQLLEELCKINERDCEPPLADGEVRKIARSVAKYKPEPDAATAKAAEAAVIMPRRKPVRVDWAALIGDPPLRAWWVQDWLTPAPTLLAGSGGVGKTLLLQALCTGLATQRGYLDEATRPLTCLIWSCEDDHDEIWRRQTAINRHFGVGNSALERLHIMPRMGADNTLYSLAFGRPVLTPLMLELYEQVNDLKVDVLALDNMAQVFGCNGNDSHHVTEFVNTVQGLVVDRPFATICTGHTARSQGSEFLGSAAWENAVRMRWYLGVRLPGQKVEDDEPADPDLIYLARRKTNYTVKDYRKLLFRGGLFVPEQIAGPADQALRNDTAEDVFMRGLARLAKMGLQPADKANAADYAPKQIIAKGLAEGHTTPELVGAMNRLMKSGRLMRGIVGKDSSRHPRTGIIVVRP